MLYSGIFFCAGVLVILSSYFLVQHNLRAGLSDSRQAELVDRLIGDRPSDVAGQAPKQPLPDDKPLLVFDDGTPLTLGALRSQLAADRQQLVDDTLWTLLVQSLVAISAVGLLSVASGWWIAGRMLAPVDRITRTARGVAQRGMARRNLHERIRLTGPQDELKELADTFDGMLERLDHAFDSQQRFVANASHELRTPLATSRTLVEVAMADPDAGPRLHRLGGSLLTVFADQQRLTDALLALAHSDRATPVGTPVDLAALVGRAVTAVTAEADAAGVELRADCAAAPTTGEPVLLTQLAHNLVQNAVRHNTPGGWVLVRTGGRDRGGWLEVSNTGAALTADEAQQAFEPFRRLDRQRTGSGAGLGLSIVRSITTAHGGTVTATARRGGGLIVRVEL